MSPPPSSSSHHDGGDDNPSSKTTTTTTTTTTTSSSSRPQATTESVQDRKRQRELHEARASGQVAPAVDVKTGQLINPHNPEFLTKRPWYLGAAGGPGGGTSSGSTSGSGAWGGEAGPSLDHQQQPAAATAAAPLTLAYAERTVQQQRQIQQQQAATGTFVVGQWVEGLKKNRFPYQICQIVAMRKKGTEFDVKYEDGTLEYRVPLYQRSRGSQNALIPRIRLTKWGNRAEVPVTLLATNNYNTDHLSDDADPLPDKVKETYDSKRDSYHGYDRDAHHAQILRKFQQREAIRRQMRESQPPPSQHDATSPAEDQTHSQPDQEADSSQLGEESSSRRPSGGSKAPKGSRGGTAGSDSDFDDSDVGSDDDSEDEFVQRDEDAKVLTTRLARQGGVGGAQMKVTARNLRIREDTAKYLRNLDPNSAYYDPKSRSMRDNPHPHRAPDQTDYVGDNFVRISGDAVALAETQLFAWEAEAKGVAEIHPQANPSQAELLKKQFKSKASELAAQRKRAILDKYGGQEHLDGSDGLAKAAAVANQQEGMTSDTLPAGASAIPDRKIRFGVSTTVEEYSADGRLIKSGGQAIKRQAIPSKYEEDVFTNGHSTVWGSYFHKGAFTWGYADDHSLLRNSYCTGENGRIANDEAHELRYGTGQAGSAALAQARSLLKAVPASNRGKASAMIHSRSKMYGEADAEQTSALDQARVKDALQKADQLKKKGSLEDDRKRKYNSMNAEVELTEEDMEAYRIRKERTSDPMAHLGSDELLDYNSTK